MVLLITYSSVHLCKIIFQYVIELSELAILTYVNMLLLDTMYDYIILMLI